MKGAFVSLLVLAAVGCGPERLQVSPASVGRPVLTPTGQIPNGVPSDPGVDRFELARLDPDALSLIFANRSSLVLQIFADQQLRLVVDDVREDSSSGRVMTAHPFDEPGHAVIRYDGHLNAVVRLKDGDVLIRHWQGDLYLVTRMKRFTPFACATRVRDQLQRSKLQRAPRDATIGRGNSVVDLLLLYTPKVVRNWPCGDFRPPQAQCDDQTKEHQVRDELQTTLTETNVFLACSGVRMHLRPAGVMQFEFNESGSVDNDLDILTGKSVGPRLKALKAARHADLASLIAWNESDYGGAITFLDILATDSVHAVSVVDSNAALKYFSLAHEIGHNVGAGHFDTDGTGDFDFSRGWFIPFNDDEAEVTIMTVMKNESQKRIPRFSGLNIKWNGKRTGTQLADNARTLNLNREIVANFDRTGASAPLLTKCPGS